MPETPSRWEAALFGILLSVPTALFIWLAIAVVNTAQINGM